MKTCPRCQEPSDDHFDSCWRCSSPLPASGAIPDPAQTALPEKVRKKADFKIFRSTFATWDSLCNEAAGFASTLGPENLITLSHSEDQEDGVIIVWFWTEDFS